jgi:hypothetical protein
MIASTSTLKDIIDEACKTHDIYSMLNIPAKKKSIVCPLPTHRHVNFTPSFGIYWKNGQQRWCCYGSCNLEGDIVDLAGYLYVPGYKKHDPESVKKALEALDMRVDFKMPEKPKKEPLIGNVWQSFIPPGDEVVQYAYKRGLSAETLGKFRIGQKDQFMTIPIFEDSQLRGLKMRRIVPGTPKYMSIAGSVQGLFNHDAVKYTTKQVLFVKGEIPVMLLDQYGILACAPTAGESTWDDYWKTVLIFSKKRVVVGDNDLVGVKNAHRRADLLQAELRFPPERYKDIDEWILADNQAIQTIKSWLKY